MISCFVSFCLVSSCWFFRFSEDLVWLAGTVRISAFGKTTSHRCFVKPFHCLKVVPLGAFLSHFPQARSCSLGWYRVREEGQKPDSELQQKTANDFHDFIVSSKIFPFIGCYGQMDVLLAQIRFAHDVGIQVVWHDVAVFEMKCQLLSNIFTYGTLRASNIWNFRQQRTAVVNVIHGIRVIQHQHLSHRNELQPGKCFDLEQHRCIGKWPSSGPLPSESNRVICSHVFALSSFLNSENTTHKALDMFISIVIDIRWNSTVDDLV